MTDPRITAFDTAANATIAHLQQEFSKLQTGRANAAMVDDVQVEAYGQRQALNTLAGVSISDARTIVVQVWDKSVLTAVEKALMTANLGGNPVNDGVVIRITLPNMTEERRMQLVKVVGKTAEEARIAIRKHRQDAHDVIKQEKDEDVRETLMGELQKSVDKANDAIAQSSKKKEEDVMKV